jgi:hypothetical protein
MVSLLRLAGGWRRHRFLVSANRGSSVRRLTDTLKADLKVGATWFRYCHPECNEGSRQFSPAIRGFFVRRLTDSE